MGSWYYVDGGQTRQGPVSADDLAEAYRQGGLGPDSLVWREGLSEWAPLQLFREELGLLDPLSVTPPAPPIAPAAAAPVPAKRNTGCLIAAAILVGGGVFLLVVLGALAAIALPAYQDYATRAKLAAVRIEGHSAKVAVQEFTANTDRCPRDAAELGLSAPSTPGLAAWDVGARDDGRCAVELTLGSLGSDDSTAGGRLLMTQEADGRWSCSAEGIPEKLLPDDCR